jgi:hypothetical protein
LIATNFGISSSSSICTCALTQPPPESWAPEW